MSDKFIGTRIKAARDRLHWSQAKLAREINVSSQAVNQIEAGKTTPTDETVRKMAGALDVGHEWLATGRGSPNFGKDAGLTAPLLPFLQDPTLRAAIASEHVAGQINYLIQILQRIESKLDALSTTNHTARTE